MARNSNYAKTADKLLWCVTKEKKNSIYTHILHVSRNPCDRILRYSFVVRSPGGIYVFALQPNFPADIYAAHSLNIGAKRD